MLKYDEVAGGALASLKKQGIAVPDKPEYVIPRLPGELTSLGDEDLMALYSQLTAYSDFVAVQVSCAQVDERQAEKKVQAKVEQLLVAHRAEGSESRVTFARAQIAVNPQVVALKDDHDVIHAYRKLIETMADNLERDSALVSRELTRRTSGIASRRTGWTP